MKQHLSVFMLMVRSSFYKILGLLALMAVAEATLFHFALDGGANLEHVVKYSRITYPFYIVFVLLTLLLCSAGCEFGSKTGYTLRRLSISEKRVFFWQCVYNTAAYLLFWAVQVLVAVALCTAYVTVFADSPYITHQTLFLAFYRSDFLHSLLPMENILFWVRNLLFFVSLGVTTAHFPYSQRRRSKFYHIYLLAPLFLVSFVWRGYSGPEIDITIIVCAVFLILSLYRVLKTQEVQYENT